MSEKLPHKSHVIKEAKKQGHIVVDSPEIFSIRVDDFGEM